jgi:3-methyladenine DNA glycosylase AlkD
MLSKLNSELKSLVDSKQAEILQKFFKTGKGGYGEGDIFLGIKVPVQRKIANKYEDLKLKDIQRLLDSKIHEHRMVGLFILIKLYNKSEKKDKKKIFNFYLKNAKANNINNWDLVDLSAPNIVGDFLLKMDRGVLYKLVKSKNLWERRISVLACFAFIRRRDFEDALRIASSLLGDSNDLIHKSVGWMLREIGKKDERVLEDFLRGNYKKIPRTTLRYSIERFEEGKRQRYLKGEF